METQIAQLLGIVSKAHNSSGKLDQRKKLDKDLMVGLQKQETLGRLERATKHNNSYCHSGSLFPCNSYAVGS